MGYSSPEEGLLDGEKLQGEEGEYPDLRGERNQGEKRENYCYRTVLRVRHTTTRLRVEDGGERERRGGEAVDAVDVAFIKSTDCFAKG